MGVGAWYKALLPSEVCKHDFDFDSEILALPDPIDYPWSQKSELPRTGIEHVKKSVLIIIVVS